MEQVPEEAIEIPSHALSAVALRGVIEAFVLREGTDYGELEHSLDDKVEQVHAQLRRGEARIMFDPRSESIDIVSNAPPRSRP